MYQIDITDKNDKLESVTVKRKKIAKVIAKLTKDKFCYIGIARIEKPKDDQEKFQDMLKEKSAEKVGE